MEQRTGIQAYKPSVTYLIFGSTPTLDSQRGLSAVSALAQ